MLVPYQSCIGFGDLHPRHPLVAYSSSTKYTTVPLHDVSHVKIPSGGGDGVFSATVAPRFRLKDCHGASFSVAKIVVS